MQLIAQADEIKGKAEEQHAAIIAQLKERDRKLQIAM